MSILGNIFQVFATLKEGQIAEAQGKFAKQIAVRNQQALERQAKAEREAAGLEERRAARKEKIIKAAQRAVIGKSGIELAGATLSLLADTAFQFSLERNLILRQGLIRSRELIYQGQMELAKGRWAYTLGRQAKQLSYVKAGASILGAAGSSPQFGALTSGVSPSGALTATGRTSSGGYIFGR